MGSGQGQVAGTFILKVYEFIHRGMHRSLLFLTIVTDHDKTFTILVYRKLFIFVNILS